MILLYFLEDNSCLEFWNHKDQVFTNRHNVGGKQFAKQVPYDKN